MQGAVTAAVNDGTGIDISQTDITVNTIAGGTFVPGNIINIDDEDMYIISIDVTGLIFTVTRAYARNYCSDSH